MVVKVPPKRKPTHGQKSRAKLLVAAPPSEQAGRHLLPKDEQSKPWRFSEKQRERYRKMGMVVCELTDEQAAMPRPKIHPNHGTGNLCCDQACARCGALDFKDCQSTDQFCTFTGYKTDKLFHEIDPPDPYPWPSKPSAGD
jgi:hypothetical protein